MPARVLLILCLLAPAVAAADMPSVDLETRFAEAVALAKAGRGAAAQALLEELTRAHPERPEPWNNLAALHAERGEWDAARAALERALATDATYQTAHRNLATVYATLASAAYRKALPGVRPPADAPRLDLLETLAMPALAPLAEAETRAETDAGPVAIEVPLPEPVATATLAPAASSVTVPVPTPTASSAAQEPAATTAAPDAASAVRAAVEAWAAAWRGKEVGAYLDAYAADFAPPGQTRAAWVAARTSRVRAPKRIHLHLTDLRVEMRGAERARVRFVQDYRSDTFTGVARKTLDLVRHDGRWLITAERTGGG